MLGLIGLACLGFFLRTIWLKFPQAKIDAEHEYLIDARTLESLTDTGSMIGMTGGGSMGYFIEGRTIINLDGLINSPDYFEALRAGEGAGFLDQWGLDYIYGSAEMLTNSDPYWQLLDGHLEQIESKGEYTLYKYLAVP
jgi:hypothetical protein